MKNHVVGFLRELHEYAAPFYHGASTNALGGGVVFGFLSPYFDSAIPSPREPLFMLLRVLFGLGAGTAYSLGAFFFTLPYLEKVAILIDKNCRNEPARDTIFSFLSLGTSFFLFVAFAYILFLVYGGRIPVGMNSGSTYLYLSWFISSLSRTNWVQVLLIPIGGILIKGAYWLVKAVVSNTPKGMETTEQTEGNSRSSDP